MATCYRHPSRETARLLLQLRAADLPGLHDPHAGRDALPRVRRPAHEGRANAERGCRAAGDLRADRDQRDRVPDRERASSRSTARASTAPSSTKACSTAPRISEAHQYYRLLTQRLPARRPAAHRLQHVPALPARHDARARDRLGAVRRDLLHLAALRLVWRAGATGAPSLGASGRDLRSDGRRRGGAARAGALACMQLRHRRF